MKPLILIIAINLLTFSVSKKQADKEVLSENDLVLAPTAPGRVFDKWKVSGKWVEWNFHEKQIRQQNENKKLGRKSFIAERKAMKVFLENLESIEAFNARKNESYKRSLSEHSDLTFEEKRAYRLGLDTTLISTRLQDDILPLNITMPSAAPPFGNLAIHFISFILMSYTQQSA